MKKIIKETVLEFHAPAYTLPVLFDSPHSGQHYPEDFEYGCDFSLLKRIEDRYVEELFSQAPFYNTALLQALFPRSYIDVNRAITDIDETLFEGKWPSEKYGAIAPTSRSDSGIGLISRLIKPGIPIYNRMLCPEEIMHRINTYYKPYHETLSSALEKMYYNHGQFWHINCHSMPNSSAYPHRALSLAGHQTLPSDIVLGDRDGQSCNRSFITALRDFWESRGYRVTVNDPFKGVELVTRYAQPTRGKNSVQIEINRALYMNEITGEKSDNFDVIQKDCTDMINFCASFARGKLTQMAAD